MEEDFFKVVGAVLIQMYEDEKCSFRPELLNIFKMAQDQKPYTLILLSLYESMKKKPMLKDLFNELVPFYLTDLRGDFVELMNENKVYDIETQLKNKKASEFLMFDD